MPGIVYGVFRDGKVVKNGAFGYSDLERKVKASTTNVFEIGSVSKQFTATVILMLMEEGKLSLDDTIDKYVDGIPESWRVVTLRHLLNHTSGIPDIEEIFGYDSYRNIYTTEQIIKVADSQPREFQPGAKWHYSNTGYYLLGLAIEKVTGKTYIEAISERILKPLGMAHSGESDPWRVVPDRALGYQFLNGKLLNRDVMQPSACKGAGTLVSTIEDMAKWDAAVTHNRLIKKSSQEMMWTPTKLTSSGVVNYGFGWFTGDWRGEPTVDHSGGTAGYSCEYRRFPNLGLSVMTFSNLYATNVGGVGILAVDSMKPGLSYWTMKPKADDKPSLKKTVLEAMKDVADGVKDSVYFTPKMYAEYNQSSRNNWKQRLDGLVSFTLLQRGRFQATRQTNLGDDIIGNDVYKLVTKGGTYFIVIGWAPDGKIALQSRVDY